MLRLIAQLCAVVALLVLASCASAPQRSPSEWMGVLPGDATMYVSVSVPQSADLIRRTLKQGGPAYNDVVQLADRTSRAVFSVTMTKGAPTRFAAVALGNYPAVLIRMSLSGKKEWKQMSASEGGYYLWNKANLQLSIPGGGVLLATNQDMPALLAKYKDPIPLPIPPEVASDMTKTDLVLYIPRLPGGLSTSVSRPPGAADDADQPPAQDSESRPRLPIREVWVDAVKTKDGYIMGASMNTATEEQSRVLSLVLRIGIVAWMKSNNVPNAAERLRAITVNPDGTTVRVKGIAVTDQEIIPLFLAILNGPAAPPDGAGNGSAQAPEQAN